MVTWGGNILTTHGTCADLVHVWRQGQTSYPAVWLHTDDTSLWSPPSFLAPGALPALHPARAQIWIATHVAGCVGSAGRKKRRDPEPLST